MQTLPIEIVRVIITDGDSTRIVCRSVCRQWRDAVAAPDAPVDFGYAAASDSHLGLLAWATSTHPRALKTGRTTCGAARSGSVETVEAVMAMGFGWSQDISLTSA
jgi:hypothetical protein